ncbi:hypothetical protein [Salimicrobium flavidum]|uniref:Uncharacterized protein n=1 Tax=Salimicrobium flavidum TaxID=570947 RepID=A0A1N7KML3_9BACI|nr:hypothetical protein [Salimicrobium flavidum]SIS62833.1 hypothetical protein SAMN05421687_11418 [Salimicrobium flavidum]
MNENEQQVLELFKETQTAYDKHMDKITHLWQEFCERKQPDIKETAPFSAALEYLASRTFYGPKLTQKKAAESYQTSPTKVSKHYHLIIDTVSDLALSYQDAMMRQIFDNPAPLPPSSDELVRKLLETPTYPGNYEQEMSQSDWHKYLDLTTEIYMVPPSEKIRMALEIYDVHPYDPDLYIIASDYVNFNHSKKRILTKAIINGENAIDPETMKELMGELWMEVDARPYMRAKAAYAGHLEDEYDLDGAILHYRDLIRLNKYDNQGVRYRLLPLYMKQGYINEARALLNAMPTFDSSPAFYEAILSFLENGMSRETKALLKKADKKNPHVKTFLKDPRRRPAQAPAYFALGDENEAEIIVADTEWLWNKCEELKKALIEL